MRAERLARRLGVRELYVKDDSVNHPTCSYKDRVVSVAATRAVELGFTVFACASTGNLANSVASHAARLGLACSVFIPDNLEPGKVTCASVFRPRIIAVRGNYDDVNRLCTLVADEYGVAHPQGMVGAAPQQCMLHDHDVGADHDRSKVAVEDGAIQHPGAGADGHVAGDDGVRSDPCGGMDIHPASLGRA